jgi:hypothetical protein
MEQLFFEFGQLSTTEVVWRILFWYFGWIPFAITFLFLAREAWLVHIRTKWGNEQKHILLAIDVPNNNDQSPRAVENMLSYLAGAQGNVSLVDKWWEGVYQLSFSYEIVSIDGYIQFLIRTPEKFQSFIETTIYSFYPDSEINVVNDYVEGTPDRFPDPEYDLWGTEFKFASGINALPIRTYPEFEHQFGPLEVLYRDPMAALMDLMSSLHKGEQLWYQIIIIPTNFDWVPKFEAEKKKILTGSSKFSIIAFVWSAIVGFFASQLNYEVPLAGTVKKEPKKMMDLDTGEKKKMEGIQRKIEKVMFEVKIRMVYLARKEVKNTPKVVNGFVGYMKQFNTNDLNSFMPDTKRTMTSANYFSKQRKIIAKQRKIMAGYKERDTTRGIEPMFMNVEELASIWHFPIASVVKAPLLQKAAARRVEAPMTLPEGEQQIDMTMPDPIFDENYEISDTEQATSHSQHRHADAENIFTQARASDQPPDNLPFAS